MGVDGGRVPGCPVGEHPVVRRGGMGRVVEIKQAAAVRGLDGQLVELDAQFRSGGSRLYEEWVLRLLGLADGGPVDWPGDENYTVRVADSPQEMEEFLAERLADGYGARMSAGLCWPWHDAERGEPLPDDVVIGDWARPWNNKNERKHGDAPGRSLWATQDGGFGQVGCVYTAQGFEYDWSGVILGPDLVWRGGQFTSDVSASRDSAFKGRGAASFDTFVRNVYKVLLTRGMMGTVLYSTDEQTRRMLKGLIRDD